MDNICNKRQPHGALTAGRLMRLADRHLKFADASAGVRGRRVLDAQGQEIGYVRALMVDEDAPAVRFPEVAFGGLLGLGETAFLVPTEAVSGVGPDEICISQTQQHVVGGPRYDPELTDITPDDTSAIYRYYGYPPFL